MKQQAQKILRWYDRHARALPWRYGGRHERRRAKPNPYYVWLSEVMLQQTQVATVIPYFHRFIKRWGTMKRLAQANSTQVLAEWAGLGYYSRARALHKTAKLITKEYKGRFPQTLNELKKLPGIGDYTAAAMMAFAFGEYAVIIDGNIKRVLSRLYAIPFDDDKKIEATAAQATPKKRSGDYAQALMDIGATLCLPQKPLCAACPLGRDCRAYQKNEVALYGRRAKAQEKPHRMGKVYIVQRADKAVFLLTRPPRGLLGGTLAFPSSGWDGTADSAPQSTLRWKKERGVITHTFTHFKLTLNLYSARATAAQAKALKGKWQKRINKQNLPTLMRKVWSHYESLKRIS